ncbi:hypothetical protein BFJ68_g1293 [Fusarium oxysporum]|uniref:Bypass of stop codon protein 6 n=1 Tax=Fusarium oxysporum TaxID=5507 RepID=A0A420S1E0_FUSOX|nr:hypothetical protein BFJ68_g1293 [Fusarium oxysporum]
MSSTATQTHEPIELTTLEGCHVRGKELEEQPSPPPDDIPPPYASAQVQRWNYPRGNIAKLAFAFLSFIIAGMNDAAVGLETYYDLSYTIISLIFLTPFAGYSVAAFTNARIHMKFGQRGVAIMAPICHLITFIALALHPPYPVLVIGISVVEWVGLTVSFWQQTGAVYQAEHAANNSEVGLGGWVVTFMLRVRKASAYASGASGTGFWAGMALGRACLGFVTERFGERLCLSIYLLICIGLQLLFWLVPKFIVSAVAVAFLGFFLGPLFPGAVMVTAKLLPAKIHVSAIGFAMAIGGTGGTVFPFAIGAIANHKGVGVLQPIILALITVVAGVWLSFPRIKKKD